MMITFYNSSYIIKKNGVYKYGKPNVYFISILKIKGFFCSNITLFLTNGKKELVNKIEICYENFGCFKQRFPFKKKKDLLLL